MTEALSEDGPFPPCKPATFVSPALMAPSDNKPAFEVKFVLPQRVALDVEQLLQPRMILDPHADPALGNAYRVTSVYFDTPNFDVYHRGDGYRSRKYRLRRYGASPTVFLERKSKRSQQVKKLRTGIPLDGIADLHGSSAEDWEGAWFVRQVACRRLQPVCRVSYERVAYAAESAEGPIRLTLDRAAMGAAAAAHLPELVADGRALLDGEAIVEFKFLGAMPVLFKEVIERLKLTPRAGSKYRRCVDAVGLLPAARRVDG